MLEFTGIRCKLEALWVLDGMMDMAIVCILFNVDLTRSLNRTEIR